MSNKTIIRLSFCDIQNNQGRGKSYQPQPSASADNPYLDLDYSGYHKNLIQYLFIIGEIICFVVFHSDSIDSLLTILYQVSFLRRFPSPKKS